MSSRSDAAARRADEREIARVAGFVRRTLTLFGLTEGLEEGGASVVSLDAVDVGGTHLEGERVVLTEVPAAAGDGAFDNTEGEEEKTNAAGTHSVGGGGGGGGATASVESLMKFRA